jgi:tetratricopeptide (TPR) repeat protein
MRNNLPLLDKYKKILKEDKTSVVFAPLAEIYRKAGDLKSAIDVCLKGLNLNPNYLSGRIVLANCYYEVEDYSKASEIISEYIKENLANNSLQKLWGKVNLGLGNKETALETFKNILFIFPGDLELGELVENLEAEISPKSLNIRDDEDRLIEIRNWEEKGLGESEIKIEVNEKTSLNFAKLFNEIGDTESVNYLLDSLEFDHQDYDIKPIVKPKIETKHSKPSNKAKRADSNLMDYFDLKASEIDLLVEGSISEKNNSPNKKQEIPSSKSNDSTTMNELVSVNNVENVPNDSILNEIKSQCDMFLNLLVKRRELALAQ